MGDQESRREQMQRQRKELDQQRRELRAEIRFEDVRVGLGLSEALLDTLGDVYRRAEQAVREMVILMRPEDGPSLVGEAKEQAAEKAAEQLASRERIVPLRDRALPWENTP